jgi:Na+-translocating ferredoxin:NAD+ oxidoreductase RNF subunit RnfB
MDRREFITRPMNLFAHRGDEAHADFIGADSRECSGVARIAEERCLAYNQTLCTVCFNKCPLQGAAMMLKDHLYPSVVEAACDGCGECVRFCPTTPAAIRIVRH